MMRSTIFSPIRSWAVIFIDLAMCAAWARSRNRMELPASGEITE